MTIRPLTQDDLRWLVCPDCHHPLLLLEPEAHLRCTGCQRLYPIVDGLPVLIRA